MSTPLGFIKTEQWETDQHVSMFVVRHRDASFAEARDQAEEVLLALDGMGLETVVSTMGLCDSTDGPWAAMHAFWGIDEPEVRP